MQSRKHKVNGDISKVRYVSGLSAAAKKILQRVQAITQKIAGTNETRTIMRYDTHAARIAHGVPLFMTLSPDEKHNLLLIRMCRSRRRDPVTKYDSAETNYGQIHEPPIDEDLLSVDLETLKELIPPHDARREMIARDSLASVDGFRTI
eukprot:11946561-Karenia_brevis.AAC.1